jgi:hypothetical protein
MPAALCNKLRTIRFEQVGEAEFAVYADIGRRAADRVFKAVKTIGKGGALSLGPRNEETEDQ